MMDILSILVFVLLATLGGYWLGYSNGHAYGYADGFSDGVEAFKEELNKKDKGD